MWTAIIIVLLIIGTIWCCLTFTKGYFRTPLREHYGGAVKRIHRIPKNSCYGICRQYYNRCMAEFQYVDAQACAGRYNNCLATCNYTDFHRL